MRQMYLSEKKKYLRSCWQQYDFEIFKIKVENENEKIHGLKSPYLKKRKKLLA